MATSNSTTTTTTTTGYIGLPGVAGTSGVTGTTGSSWAATYSTSAYYTSSTVGLSGMYSIYYPPVEIKFGFTLQFKNSKAKLIKLLGVNDTSTFVPSNELKKIL